MNKTIIALATLTGIFTIAAGICVDLGRAGLGTAFTMLALGGLIAVIGQRMGQDY